MIDGLAASASHLLNAGNLAWLGLGTALGIVFGAIPGLTATMGLALLVPFTFSMDPAAGLMMLAGIYVGAMYGDAIPAILINTPGTPAAIATTFDGYPLARKGMAQHALIAAAFASCVGSIIANIVLATSAGPLAAMSLKFGPPEYFWLGVFGLTIISVLSAGNLLRGFTTATVGLLLSTVGMATLAGDVRLTFGFPELQGGIGLAGALIGFFCLPEILANVIGKRRETYAGEQVRPNFGVIVDTIVYLAKRPVLMIRSSLIGLVVGIAPGAGGNIASMVSYSEATRWDENKEEFGTGTIRGVAASESANSAMAPGSLIPLLTLGIPGSPPAAVILGALMLHGMQPGHELFSAYSGPVYAFIFGLGIAAIAVLFLGSAASFLYARIINVPSTLLAPIILLMSVLGAYAIRNNFLDVWVMLIFGVVGFCLNRLSYHPAPLVLGFILGPYVENGLVQSIMLGGAAGNVFVYMTWRPICLVLIGLCLISALWPILARKRTTAGTNTETPAPRPVGGGANADLLMGVATLSIAILVVVNTQGLSRFGSLFVHYSAGFLALLSIFTIFRSLKTPSKLQFFESIAERQRVLWAIGIFIAYLLLMPFTGFLLASIGFYLAMQFLLDFEAFTRTKLVRTLLMAIVVPAILFYLFQELLHVPLP